MKIKSFTVILVCVVVPLLLIVEVNAMPKATIRLAQEYFECRIYDNVSNLTEHFKNILDSLYAGVGGEGVYDPEVYDAYTQGMEKSISEMKNRESYTQEQAINEIGRMIDNNRFPANYIFTKGQYKYVTGINAVVTTTNVNLRSQPNANARILCVISGSIEMDGGPAGDICSYMGEWTNPQGDRWVAVNFNDYEKGDLIGWLNGKYTQFITDAQVTEILRAYESAKATPRTTARNEYSRQEDSSYSQPYSSGVSNASEKVYQCVVCGERRILSANETAANLPEWGCGADLFNFGGSRHIWNKLQ